MLIWWWLSCCRCRRRIPENLQKDSQPSDPRSEWGRGQTLISQISPTFCSRTSSPSNTSPSCSFSEDSSFNPCSLAKCNKQMKQKLVLISSILSFGYVFCRPVITWPNWRASDGSVRGLSESTSFHASVSLQTRQRYARKPHHFILVLLFVIVLFYMRHDNI